MPSPTRRTMMGGMVAAAALPAEASATPLLPGTVVLPDGTVLQASLAGSYVVMTEDGAIFHVGMSQEASLHALKARFRWSAYRAALRLNDDEWAMRARQEAEAACVPLAEQLRSERFAEAEIAAYLTTLRDGSVEPDWLA